MPGKRGNPNLKKGGPSLNPAGRPKGSKNPLTTMQNNLIEEFAGELKKDFKSIIRKVVKEAKNGDMVAAKMLLDRAIPARKAVEHYGAGETMGGVNIIISTTEGRNVIEQDDISEAVIVSENLTKENEENE